jgi:CelD/BcsL family acetyltransferase involved in cellulose biosynthesis
LHAIDAFDRHAEAWDRVNRRSGGIPFLASLFIRNALREFGRGDEKLAVLGAPGTERALGVLWRKRSSVWETFQPSQLPLGAWVMERGLDYAPAVHGLLRRLPRFPLLLSLTQQDPWLHARPDGVAGLGTLDYIETAWVEVDQPFDAYWAARGKNLRHNMRKQRAQLERDGIRTSLDVITTPEAVAQAIDDYATLESSSWKGEAGTAVAAGTAQGRFYRAMLEDFCRIGAGRIFRYRFDDKVVSVDLCIEGGDNLVVLKTTFDTSYKQLSPAFLMREDAFRGIFDERRIRRIEFYGRRMEWHQRWTDLSRTLYHINGYRWNSLPQLHAKLSAWRQKRAAATPAMNQG